MNQNHFESATHTLGTTLARAAEALLRSLGDGRIVLRLPLPTAVAGSDLGLGTPLVEDVELRPAMLRLVQSSEEGSARYEAAIAARAVEEEAQRRNFETPEGFLAAALGLVHGGKLLRIASAAPYAIGAKVYLYRLEVRG